ncbi:Ger(x)C family spore germination protein [Niallia sp. 03133]|uniref:Ger(x)C family spore germination protein n=1 Tax=Niallia sp. 03133 TaxID=3458060 RepID=UPI004043DFE0
MNMPIFHLLLKTIMVLFICVNCVFLTGCWDRREVYDMAIVLGTAIDKTEEGEIEVTLQILVPRAVSGGQDGSQSGGGKVVFVRSEKGKNIADATSSLEMKLSRNIFWGHCKMFIIGEQLAKDNGIRKELDFLIRYPQPRERGYIYISEGDAKKILAEPPRLELYVGEGMRKMIEKKIVVKKTVKEVEEMLTSDTKSIVLPLIRMVKGDQDTKNLLTIYDAAIFNKDKMAGVINNDQMRGLLWIRNETKVNAITVPVEKQNYVSVRVIKQSTKLKPIIKRGKWTMHIDVLMKCDVIQNQTKLDTISPKIVGELEKAVEKKTKQTIEDAVHAMQDDTQVDVFGFADAFHKKYPKEWRRVSKNWNEFFPQVNVSTNVKTDVLRSGLTTLPAGLKKDEVKK